MSHDATRVASAVRRLRGGNIEEADEDSAAQREAAALKEMGFEYLREGEELEKSFTLPYKSNSETSMFYLLLDECIVHIILSCFLKILCLLLHFFTCKHMYK